MAFVILDFIAGEWPNPSKWDPGTLKLDWNTLLVPYNSLESALFSTFAQRCTYFYLIKWSMRYYKEEKMSTESDCFVLQSLDPGAIISSIPGTGMSYLFLFLLSSFQWIAPGWWSSTSTFVLQPIHPFKTRLPLQKTLPGLCLA